MSENQPISMQLNDNKAGMKHLDKNKINEIIIKESQGTKYYANEKQKASVLDSQIKQMLKTCENLTSKDIVLGETKADEMIQETIENRSFYLSIVHIDMDAFYAAVETLDEPSFRGKPMAVGSMSMLSTSNYEARKFGVRAAMPGFIAMKLCPQLTIVELNFDKYSRMSKIVRELIAEYDKNFEMHGLDEASLDLTAHLQRRMYFNDDQMTFQADRCCGCQNSEPLSSFHSRLWNACRHCGLLIGETKRTFSISAWGAVAELRFRILMRTGLTSSAGIGPNFMLAKIASDLHKPCGQYQVSSVEQDVDDFMANIAIRKVPFIGPVTEAKLKALDIVKCGDIIGKRGILYHLFKPAHFSYFMRIPFGDYRSDQDYKIDAGSDQKSMSVERTFSDCDNAGELLEKCRLLCENLCDDLSRSHLKGKCISIKLKLATFEKCTRSITISQSTRNVETVAKLACKLLQREINNCLPNKLCLRLLGVRMSSLNSDVLDDQSNKMDFFVSHSKKLKSSPDIEDENSSDNTKNVLISKVECPICFVSTDHTTINEHLDRCLQAQDPMRPSTSSSNIITTSRGTKKPSVVRGPLDKFISRHSK